MYDILTVDDEYSILQGLKYIIDWSDYGFQITDEAQNATDAILKANKQNFDVILCDIRMPDMDGLEMIEYLRISGYKGSIVVMSGYKEFEYAKRAFDNNVFRYLLKPICENEITKVLKELKEELDNKKVILNYKKTEQNKKTPLGKSEEIISEVNQILDLIRNGRKDDVEKALEDIYKSLELYEYYQYGPVHTIIMDILIKINRVLAHFGSNIITISGKNFSQCIVDNCSLESLKSNLSEICKKSAKYVSEINNNSTQDIVESIVSYMHDNINKDLTLKEISSLFFMNQFYIGRIFKKSKGVTFNEYLKEARIDKAKELLSYTELKIYEICHKVGYKDINYFGKIFKEVTGMTPSDYKANI